MSLPFTKRMSSVEDHLNRIFVTLILCARLRGNVAVSSLSTIFTFPICHSWSYKTATQSLYIRFFSVLVNFTSFAFVFFCTKNPDFQHSERNVLSKICNLLTPQVPFVRPLWNIHEIPHQCIFHSISKLLKLFTLIAATRWTCIVP